jgi:hypothetical protein
MKIVKSLLVLSAFAVIFGGIFATAAIAQSPKGSSLTLEEPLEIGDTILEPGAYVITVVPGDRRDVLTVTSEDGTETFATVLTTPHTATATAEQKRTQYVYFPTTAGSTRTLKTWFAPDSAAGYGYDVVYPETRAMELATVANGPVVAYKDGTVAADLTTTELEVVAPDKEVMVYVAPGDAVADDTEEPVEVAETPPRDRPMTASELPTTASRLPLFAALGFLLLLAAGGVRILRTV